MSALSCPYCQNAIEVAEHHTLPIVCATCGNSFRQPEDQTRTYLVESRRLDRFELLERVGAGAFGVVWKARDDKLGRIVAVKIPHGGGLGGRGDDERFLREARSAAQLRHPNVVTVHEVGHHDGLPFLVAEFITGVTLSDLLTARRLSFRETVELVAQVADALDYAHSMGVVHRDIKPSNIMLDRTGLRGQGAGVSKPTTSDSGSLTPLLMDFGLALRDDAEVTMTLDGQVLGTPAYMSPEQAAGLSHKVDGRSDLYSLGVVLFQLLTGELPYQGNSRMLIDQVLRDEPRPPRRLNHRIPRDLETITLKCLAKEPARRYQKASELAADLRRWLAGEPIQARPIGTPERFWRWCRRNPALAILMGTAALLLVTVAVVACAGYRHTAAALAVADQEREEANHQKEEAIRQRDAANRHLYRSLVGEACALRLARAEGYRERTGSLLKQALALDTPDKDVASLRQEAVSCLGDFVGVEPTTWTDFPTGVAILAVAIQSENGLVAVGLSDKTIALHSAATGAKVARLDGHQAPIAQLNFLSGGGQLASADEGGIFKVWEPNASGIWTCVRTISAYFFNTRASMTELQSGDRPMAYAAILKVIRRWQLTDGTELRPVVVPEEVALTGWTISPDGQLGAVSYGFGAGQEGVLVWDVTTGAVKQRIASPWGLAAYPTFSPDGALLAFSAGDQGMLVYETRTFRQLTFLRTDSARKPCFSPDSRRLAFTTITDVLVLWDVSYEANSPPLLLPNAGDLPHLTFSPDGKFLLSAGSRKIRLRRLTMDDKLVLAGHRGGIPAVRFSPDGTMLASGSKDRSVTLWDLATGRALRTQSGFADFVQALAFSPDGRVLATGDWSGGGLKLWEVDSLRERAVLKHSLGHAIYGVAFTPDGKYLIASGAGLVIWKINRPTGQPADVASWTFEQVGRVAGSRSVYLSVSKDSKRVAWVNQNANLKLWDLENGREVPFPGPPPLMGWHNVALHPDNKQVAYITRDRIAEFWDIDSGRQTFTLGRRGEFAGYHACLSPDGRFFAADPTPAAATVWDTQARQRLWDLPAERAPIWSLDWDLKGEHLALGLADGGLVIWNVPRIRAHLERLELGW